MRERPNSSTVQVKSVPRIVILAVGVLSWIFCFAIFPSLLVINLAVPLANLRAILDLDGSGSKIYSSMTNLLCSVSLTFESSRKVIAIRPLRVIAWSLDAIAKSNLASYALSLNTSAFPFNSETPPILTTGWAAWIWLNNANIRIRTVLYDLEIVTSQCARLCDVVCIWTSINI